MRLKRFLLMMIFGILALGSVQAQDESTDDLYNQFSSMEYRKWGFTPKWYYYSWYRKSIRVLGVKISWDEPGLGVHDNGPAGIAGGDGYVNERWRMMSPLRVTAATEAALQANNTDDEREFWKDINIKDAAVFLDRSTDLPLVGASAVTSVDRDEFSQQILDNIYAIRRLADEDQQLTSGSHTNPSWAQDGDILERPSSKYDDIADELKLEYDVIREEISAVANSHEANANRLRLLQDCNNRLQKLSRKSSSIYATLYAADQPWMKNLTQMNKKWRRKQ